MVEKLTKSYYFQHDYNASNDAKILFLRQQLGMEGYGIFWFIVEQLAQSGGKLPIKIIPVLAMQSQTQESKVRAVIEGYELFQIVDGQFFSIRLNNHLEIRKHLSENGKLGATARWSKKQDSLPNGHPNSHPITPPNAKESKERKVKKEKKSKVVAPPQLLEVIEYFQSKGYDQDLAQRAYEYYQLNDWKDKDGKPVVNWKSKFLSVWMKEPPKQKYHPNSNSIPAPGLNGLVL